MTMNTKELIDRLERIEGLALEIKGRPAASAIAVHAQELIRGLHQSYPDPPMKTHDDIKERIFLLLEELDEFEQKQVAIFALSRTLTPLSFTDISKTCRAHEQD